MAGLLICLLFMGQLVHAQEVQVNGIVTDKGGAVLPGVNVLIKNTTKGTTADASGAFSIVAQSSDILVVSFHRIPECEVIGGKSDEHQHCT